MNKPTSRRESKKMSLTLAVSSVSFAIATILDLANVEGPWRILAVGLSALGFLSLGVSAVIAWIADYRKRVQYRQGAIATLSASEEIAPQETANSVPKPELLPAAVPPKPVVVGRRIPAESVAGLRLAGMQDIQTIVQAGKTFLGDAYFYDEGELEAYLLAQRDSIWCMTGDDGELTGYVILLALKPSTVERIKAGEIALGRHILSSDIETSIDETDAVYIGMIHGFSRSVGLVLGEALLRRVLRSEEIRRPQLVLARRGTIAGSLRMNALGFKKFGNAPHIEATYTDNPSFNHELARRNNLQKRAQGRR